MSSWTYVLSHSLKCKCMHSIAVCNLHISVYRNLHKLCIQTSDCFVPEADLGMCGLCGRTGAPTKRGPPHEDKHKFFIAANLLQHAEKSLN